MSKKLIELATDAHQETVDDAIRKSREAVSQPGLNTCSSPACFEPISALRRQLGAQYCIDCLEEIESRGCGI